MSPSAGPAAEIDRDCPHEAASAPTAQADQGEVNGLRDAASERLCQLLKLQIRYVYHPSFDDPATATEILGPVPDLDDIEVTEHQSQATFVIGFSTRPPLTRAQEVHLFRKYNFLKYRAAQLRNTLDPANSAAPSLDCIEALNREAGLVRNRIICSNLPLVVFVARKWGPRGHDFLELVSDGNIALLRAVERFDITRGARFCTYAYWAIQRDFARKMPKERLRRMRFSTGHRNVFRGLADHQDADAWFATDQEHACKTILRMLAALDERERRIITQRFGLAPGKRTLCQLGVELGISKERVRQIERRALDKLRTVALSPRLGAP
jgi:RNA polymerase primary sigma factor